MYVSVEENTNVQNSCGAFNDVSKDIDPQSNEFKNISWERLHLQLQSNDTAFLGDSPMPMEVTALRTPCDFFTYFVTNEFLTEVANQTNLYACQTKPNEQFEINIIDLKKYIGILIFMSVYNYPNVRSNWGRYSFGYIRSLLHFADNTKMPTKDQPDYDVLYKIRPVVEHFRDRFSSIPMPQHVCVDEQMCQHIYR